jgi:hypothetical protein
MNGPFSVRKPTSEGVPGPPFSHSATGSVLGSFSLSTYQSV